MKTTQEFELNEDQLEWLREMVQQYELEDENKALRIVLDHAMQETDAAVVFEEIRCHHCG